MAFEEKEFKTGYSAVSRIAITNIMFDRIKYFINAIENGENELINYDFTINLYRNGGKVITIKDNYKPILEN